MGVPRGAAGVCAADCGCVRGGAVRRLGLPLAVRVLSAGTGRCPCGLVARHSVRSGAQHQHVCYLPIWCMAVPLLAPPLAQSASPRCGAPRFCCSSRPLNGTAPAGGGRLPHTLQLPAEQSLAPLPFQTQLVKCLPYLPTYLPPGCVCVYLRPLYLAAAAATFAGSALCAPAVLFCTGTWPIYTYLYHIFVRVSLGQRAHPAHAAAAAAAQCVLELVSAWTRLSCCFELLA